MDDCGRDDYAGDYNDDDGVANNVPWGRCEFEATEKNVVNREASNPGEVKSKEKVPEQRWEHLQRTINKTEPNYERAQDTMDSGHDGGFGGCLECSVMQSSKTKL